MGLFFCHPEHIEEKSIAFASVAISERLNPIRVEKGASGLDTGQGGVNEIPCSAHLQADRIRIQPPHTTTTTRVATRPLKYGIVPYLTVNRCVPF